MEGFFFFLVKELREKRTLLKHNPVHLKLSAQNCTIAVIKSMQM